MKFCPECGNVVGENDKKCWFCNRILEEEQSKAIYVFEKQFLKEELEIEQELMDLDEKSKHEEYK
jgi:uncharacterized membrane protein YvbJ